MNKYINEINAIKELIVKCGEIILAADRDEIDIESKVGSANFVTDYDKRVQDELRDGLLEIMPQAHFIGEEGEKEQFSETGMFFIVDPIDGTTNFIKDYHVSGISVALVKDGKAYVVGNALRINIHDQIVVGCDDTYMRLGEDGKISSRVINDYAVEFDENPNTGVKFKDLVFPGVKEAFEMCKEAALVVPEIRYVGWDVVLTDDGPLLLEGNEFPSYGLIQYYLFNDEREGHLATIAKILGDEMNDIDL